MDQTHPTALLAKALLPAFKLLFAVIVDCRRKRRVTLGKGALTYIHSDLPLGFLGFLIGF